MIACYLTVNKRCIMNSYFERQLKLNRIFKRLVCPSLVILLLFSVFVGGCFVITKFSLSTTVVLSMFIAEAITILAWAFLYIYAVGLTPASPEEIKEILEEMKDEPCGSEGIEYVSCIIDSGKIFRESHRGRAWNEIHKARDILKAEGVIKKKKRDEEDILNILYHNGKGLISDE
ncbi:hypothetical protein AGJ33_19870 [Cronobacter dublinensis subsp. dublinensis]|nr:hypothetical protein [Cronobacter dublinensis subsp. dublinensis]